jgi:ATP-dependent exoDNAse (exonuclease V) beta subunit
VDVLWTDHGPELRLDKDVTTRDYEATRALDDQLDEHERRRLLYVGCTRARDHLVVSVHRLPRGTRQPTLAELITDAVAELDAMAAWEATSEGSAATPGTVVRSPLYELLAPVGDDGDDGADGRPLATPDERPAGSDPNAGGLAPAERPFDLERWRAEHDRVLATSGRPRTTAATSLAGHDDEHHTADDPGLAKAGVDLDTPPWHKGRYGTAIGRAVHAVLQTVDLATGEGLEAAAGAQAAAEGVLGRERTIAALARSALRSPIVHEALTAPALWREVLVAAPVGEQLLEGYIDLLFRADDGLVVVDYKTDQPRDADDLEARVARYRLQLAAYALGVERVTGERVDRAVLVFCSPRTPAQQREVEDLAGAMREVADRLGAASGGTPPPLLA